MKPFYGTFRVITCDHISFLGAMAIAECLMFLSSGSIVTCTARGDSSNFAEWFLGKYICYVNMLRLPKVCEAHSDVRSTSLLGGSGGMPPQENFENLIYRDGF